MSALKSIFGGYTDKLQVIIDNSQNRFRPTWYSKYFTFAPPQATLDYTAVIGRSRLEAAASIVDRDGQTPLRSRAALGKLSGEIPAIKEAFKMKESDYRDFLAIQALNTNDDVKKQQILDLIWNDVKNVGDSAHKRLDILCLQAVSTGKISINISNNPDGLTTADIDLLMPSGNKTNADVAWATSASATPITDISNVVTAASGNGRTFSKILMDRATFMLFAKAKETIDSLVSYNQLQKGAAIATLEKVNDFLTANQFPVIEITDVPVGIEKDGVISSVRPFETSNVAFIPDGGLGVIKNAMAMEEMRPATNVNYASFNRALISKWSENEPFGEWTKVELNAFPAFEAIDGVYLLSVTKAFS